MAVIANNNEALSCSCAGQWDCVCPGLLRLALALLDSGQFKGGALAAARGSAPQLDPASEQLTRLGTRILRLMFKVSELRCHPKARNVELPSSYWRDQKVLALFINGPSDFRLADYFD